MTRWLVSCGAVAVGLMLWGAILYLAYQVYAASGFWTALAVVAIFAVHLSIERTLKRHHQEIEALTQSHVLLTEMLRTAARRQGG